MDFVSRPIRTIDGFFRRPRLCRAPRIDSLLKRARLSKVSTRLFGPLNITNHNRIEINVTFDCNLKCLNCNRSCRQAPSEDHMTVKQLEKFATESQDKKRRWEQLVVMGGEPTMHPKIFEILDVLISYKKQCDYEPRLILATNGFGPKAKDILSRIPSGVKIRNTNKKSALQKEFYPFNLAPADFADCRNADHSNKCDVTWCGGVGLSKYGYYLCANASGIDRIFGLDLGRKALPPRDDQMIDQAQMLCRFCGRFRVGCGFAEGEQISSTWKTAYAEYRSQKPILTEY